MTTSLLRPLTAGEILDGAFAIYRRHFGALMATSLAFLAPTTIITLLLPGVGGILASLVMVLPLTATLIFEASDAILGRPVDLKTSVKAALPRLLPLLGADLLLWLALSGSLLLLVLPIIFFATRLFAVPMIAVLEPGAKPLRRSFALSKGLFNKIFGVIFVAGMIGLIPAMVLRVGTHMSAVTAGDWKAFFAADTGIALVLQQLVAAVLTPFTTTVSVVLYYDARVRKDGFDVSYAAQALGQHR